MSAVPLPRDPEKEAQFDREAELIGKLMEKIANERETAIVITEPETGHQVLVRLPGHIAPSLIQVDFRQTPGDVWMPSQFFEDSLEVTHQ
jgi:hypothetical protein